jgi:hypothetical protein
MTKEGGRSEGFIYPTVDDQLGRHSMEYDGTVFRGCFKGHGRGGGKNVVVRDEWIFGESRRRRHILFVSVF